MDIMFLENNVLLLYEEINQDMDYGWSCDVSVLFRMIRAYVLDSGISL